MGQIYSLTYREAEKIMAAAVHTLETQFKSAAVTLVNRDGTEIASIAMDGVRPFTIYVAALKARQAAWVGKPTDETWKQIISGELTAEIIGIEPEMLVPWAGGMPIYDNENHLIGGIGVSNLKQEEDAMVAENAVHKAGFRVRI